MVQGQCGKRWEKAAGELSAGEKGGPEPSVIRLEVDRCGTEYLSIEVVPRIQVRLFVFENDWAHFFYSLDS